MSPQNRQEPKMSNPTDSKGDNSDTNAQYEFEDMPPLEEIPMPSNNTTSSFGPPRQDERYRSLIRDGYYCVAYPNMCYSCESLNNIGFKHEKEI